MKTFFINDFQDDQYDKKILATIPEISNQSSYTWTDPERIYEIFKLLSGCIRSHSILTPDGIEIILEKVDLTDDLSIDFIYNYSYRFKVKSLTYEPINSGESYYFFVETITLKPTGIYEGYQMTPFCEIVTEIEPGNYFNSDVYQFYNPDIDHFMVMPRLIYRHISGSIMILHTDNQYRETHLYDGFHICISREELTDLMESFYRKPGNAIL